MHDAAYRGSDGWLKLATVGGGVRIWMGEHQELLHPNRRDRVEFKMKQGFTVIIIICTIKILAPTYMNHFAHGIIFKKSKSYFTTGSLFPGWKIE